MELGILDLTEDLGYLLGGGHRHEADRLLLRRYERP
jgi:hypothetical protein